MEGLASAALRNMDDLNPHDLSGTAWAFATLSYSQTELLQAISQASIQRLSEFHSQDLANTAWSFAKVMVLDGSLLEAVWTVGASQRRAVANRGIEASEADRFDFHKFHEVSISSW